METSFTDSDGVLWNVREDGADDARSFASDLPPGTTWLRFESEMEVRRLWHYPDDWRGLSPVQMESLLDRASTVIARFRSASHRVANGDTTIPRGGRTSPDLRPPNRADKLSADPTPLGEEAED